MSDTSLPPLWSRRSVRIFFLIGFGVPWLGWTINAVTTVEPPLRTVLFYFGDFMAIAGIVATWVAGGGPAVRALLRRCVTGAGIGWWLFAAFLPLGWLLLARLGYGIVHGGIGAIDPGGLALYFTWPVLRAVTTGPLGEEAGWRGFLLPRLLTRYRPLVASLILGVIWSVWHFTLYVHTVFSTVPGALRFTASVLCFTVLMTVLFHRTRGSVLLAMLLHWTVNITPSVAAGILPLAHGVGPNELRYYELGALALVTVVVVAVAGWRTLGARSEFDPARDLAGEAVSGDAKA